MLDFYKSFKVVIFIEEQIHTVMFSIVALKNEVNSKFIKNLLFCLLFFIPVYSFSQIEIKEKKDAIRIGEISPGKVWLMSLELSNDSSTYIFSYRNLAYQQIIDVKSFSIASADIDKFYNTIIANIESPEKKEFEMKLANGDVLTLTFHKNKVSFSVWNGSVLSYSQYFSKKQINELFAKK